MPRGNWYQLLKLDRHADAAAIAAAVERLSRQAAALANTAPERSQALRETVRAIKQDLLSGDAARRRYDGGLMAREPVLLPPPPASPRPGQPDLPRAAARPSAPPAAPERSAPGARSGGRLRHFLRNGWACPGCGEGALPSDRFCPRCGTSIPVPGALVDAVRRRPEGCPKCGEAVPRGARFCGSCGAPQPSG